MELAVIDKEVNQIILSAKSIVVTNNDEESFALEFCKSIKRGQKIVGDEFDENIEKAHATHKGLVAQRSKYLNPLKEAEDIVKNHIKKYRLNLEIKRREEEERQKAILEAQLKKEQERLMKEAEEANARGDKEKAESLAVQSVFMETGGVSVETKAIKQEGMSEKIVWKARVTDIQMLPMKFWTITANQKMIDDHVKLHGRNHPLTGVEYYQDVKLSVRI